MEQFDTVDNYIGSFSQDIRKELETIRSIIKKLAPEAIESMSYGMPSYKLNKKPLVYFAGYKTYIGFYPTPNGIDAFKEELVPYNTGKGTAQFPFNKPLPEKLIEKIVKFRIEELKK